MDAIIGSVESSTFSRRKEQTILFVQLGYQRVFENFADFFIYPERKFIDLHCGFLPSFLGKKLLQPALEVLQLFFARTGFLEERFKFHHGAPPKNQQTKCQLESRECFGN